MVEFMVEFRTHMTLGKGWGRGMRMTKVSAAIGYRHQLADAR